MILKVKDENGHFKEVILKGTRGEKGDKGDKGDRGEDGTVLQQKEIDNIKTSLDNIANKFEGRTGSDFDNYSAFVNACSGNKRVYIPHGQYYIKTPKTINIASNTELIFEKGAEVIIDTGYTMFMVTPFKGVGVENVIFRNLKIKGITAPTKRANSETTETPLIYDGFIRFENSKNIRFEGKTHIENATNTFIHFIGIDGFFIEDFHGKQSNADGIFMRYCKNGKLGKIIVENTGDDGVSIADDVTINKDGVIDVNDNAIGCENIYVDTIEAIGKSIYDYASASAGLYICSSKNIYVKSLIVKERTQGFRTHVGHNTGSEVTGAIYNYNINIDKIYCSGLTDHAISMRGYVKDTYDLEKFKTLINLGNIIVDNCTSIIDVSAQDINNSYLCGILNIESIIVSDNFTNGFILRNQEFINIKNIYAPYTDIQIKNSYNNIKCYLGNITCRSLVIQEGCKNVEIDSATIRNAFGTGLLCSASNNTYYNKVSIKKLFIEGFDTNNLGKHGIETNNTNLKVDFVEIYNYNLTPNNNAHSLTIWTNSNIVFGDVYSEWSDSTDDNRMNILNNSSVNCTYNIYKYKNASNVSKVLKFKTSGVSANRPTESLYIGFMYYDTTLGKPIYWNGNVWTDSIGTTV